MWQKGKIENNCTGFFKQENRYNKITSVRKSSISKSVKKIGEKFGNILAFDKESERKLLSHIHRQFY